MLDEEGKGELAIEDFVQAVMTMRGSARAKDLMNFVVLIQSLSNRAQAMEKYVVELRGGNDSKSGLGSPIFSARFGK